MSETNRRSFLLHGGAGAAVVGAVLLAPGVADAATSSTAPAGTTVALPAGAASMGPIVAYVEDVTAGTISVLVGDRSVVLHDTAMAAKLAHAAVRP